MKFALIALPVLSGCIYMPAQLATDGDVVLDLRSTRAQDAAIRCLAERTADSHPLLSAQPRAGDVYIYWRGELWAIAAINSVTGGSHVVVRVQPDMIMSARDRAIDAMRGC